MQGSTLLVRFTLQDGSGSRHSAPGGSLGESAGLGGLGGLGGRPGGGSGGLALSDVLGGATGRIIGGVEYMCRRGWAAKL